MNQYMDLEQRMQRIEAKLKVWKLGALLSVSALVGFVTLGAAGRAKDFVVTKGVMITDECGVVRAELKLDSGEPVLNMFGTGGQLIQLAANRRGQESTITVSRRNSSARASVQVMDSSSRVSVVGSELGSAGGQREAALTANADGNSSFFTRMGSNITVRGLSQIDRAALQVYRDGQLVDIEIP